MSILSTLPFDAKKAEDCNGVDYIVASRAGTVLQFDAIARTVVFDGRYGALDFKLMRPDWRVYRVENGRLREVIEYQLRAVSLPGDEAALIASGKQWELCLPDYNQYFFYKNEWLAIYASKQRALGKAAVPCVDGAIVALVRRDSDYYLKEEDARPAGYSAKRPLVCLVNEVRPLPQPEPVRWATHTWKWRVPQSLVGFVAQHCGLADKGDFVLVKLTDGNQVYDKFAVSPGYIGALNESVQRETSGELWWEVCDA